LKAAFLRFIGIQVQSPNLDQLTPAAHEILALGGKEALGFGHDFIGTEHVLLGLLEFEPGIVPAVLRKMGVDLKVVRNEIEKIVGPGPVGNSTHTPPYTPRVKRALRLANAEARSLKQTHVDAEHIFLGLCKENGGVAAMVLKALGVNIERAREEIELELRRRAGLG
jgi:ATP-dependent Clp protease ATP-binding subunit ClpC